MNVVTKIEMAEARTDRDGFGYFDDLDLPDGQYSISASLIGHYNDSVDFFVGNNSSLEELQQDSSATLFLLLCPVLAENEVVLVLHWQNNPSDKEALFSTPWGCEVSLDNPVCTTAAATTTIGDPAELRLMGAHESGYGPQTIAGSCLPAGAYEYRVHQFLPDADLFSTARVVLYLGLGAAGRALVLTAPAPDEGVNRHSEGEEGLWWRALQLEFHEEEDAQEGMCRVWRVRIGSGPVAACRECAPDAFAAAPWVELVRACALPPDDACGGLPVLSSAAAASSAYSSSAFSSSGLLGSSSASSSASSSSSSPPASSDSGESSSAASDIETLGTASLPFPADHVHVRF
jgi:hypothetical protein